MQTVHSFETLGITCPTIHHHIPEDQNPQLCQCKNYRTHKAVPIIAWTHFASWSCYCLNFLFRQSDRYYNGDIIVLQDDIGDPGEGIDNNSATIEYRDTPPPSSKPSQVKPRKPQNSFDPRKTASTPSLQITGSSASLKDTSDLATSSPTGEKRKQPTPIPTVRKPKTRVDEAGVPQTEV
jgi:hypothetical protein